MYSLPRLLHMLGGGLAGKVLDNCKDVSAFSLILLFTLPDTPHRHTFDTQLRGRFAAFAGSSKQSEEAWYTSILQWGQSFISLGGPNPAPVRGLCGLLDPFAFCH